MTNTAPDLANARCLFIIGSNLSENHPIVARWVMRAKDNMAKIIVADPRRTPTTWISDLHLPVRPGTDIALLNAMMHVIVKEGLHDAKFLADRTSGVRELLPVLERYSPEASAEITGVPASDIVRAARMYAASEASAIVYCMGVTQHVTGTRAVMSCANLAMLCGQIGRPGTGVNPLRGQNNVQGACDMGGLPNVFPGYQPVVDPAVRERFAKAWGAPVDAFSPKAGLTALEIEHAALHGEIKAMYIMGENPMVVNPNSKQVRESLSKLDFLIMQDIFANEASEFAHLLLPAAAWAERSGSKTATDRRVQWTFQAVEPIGEAKPDWWIISQVAKRLGFDFNYEGPGDILNEIMRVAPSYGGMTPERLQTTIGGIHWPCPDTAHPGTPVLHTVRFPKPDGLGLLSPVEYEPVAEPTDASYPLVLTTGRLSLHYNSGAMTRRTKPLIYREPQSYVEIHREDAAPLGIRDGDRVRVSSRRSAIAVNARVTDTIARGVVFMPFHFVETNELTIAALDPTSRIPQFKAAACRIEKIERGEENA